MTTPDAIYSTPGPMTSAGAYAGLLGTLPRELPALVRAVQGLQIHEFMLSAYGVSAPEARLRESHLRRIDHMLAALAARDRRPLDVARAPAQRLVGVCRHFTLWVVAALRAQGAAARARVGFGSYLNPGRYEDHWVAEVWDAEQRRFRLVDAQLDALQREHMHIDFDPLDVPRDRFLVAHDAWTRWRSGELAAERFGLTPVGLQGAWFIAGNLVRDAAALNGMELLPWDVWGAMPKLNAALSPEQITLGDRLARLTAAPDLHVAELRAQYATPALYPGTTVYSDRMRAHQRLDAAPVGLALG